MEAGDVPNIPLHVDFVPHFQVSTQVPSGGTSLTDSLCSVALWVIKMVNEDHQPICHRAAQSKRSCTRLTTSLAFRKGPCSRFSNFEVLYPSVRMPTVAICPSHNILIRTWLLNEFCRHTGRGRCAASAAVLPTNTHRATPG